MGFREHFKEMKGLPTFTVVTTRHRMSFVAPNSHLVFSFCFSSNAGRGIQDRSLLRKVVYP